MRRRLWVLPFAVAITLISVVVAGCQTAPPAAKPAAPSPATRQTVELEYLATSAGTTSYVSAAAIADIINKNIPWIKVSLTATLGSDQNVIDGNNKDPKKVIIQLTEASYLLSTAGLPPFQKKYTNAKFIAGYASSYQYWATLDPNIKGPQDFIGKRIAISPVAQFNGKVGEWLLQEYGIMDKVRVSRMDFTASAEAMKDGLVDVIIVGQTGSSGVNSPPIAATRDLLETRADKIRFLSWDYETLGKVEQRQGVRIGKATIPPGTLGPRQTEPIQALMFGTTQQAAFDGADPDVIYEITKTIATKYQDLRAYNPALKDVTPERMVSSLPIKDEKELSPGALKYYREAGLWPLKK